MLRIDFTQEDIDQLHYERYHYPHPLVQKKMEASQFWILDFGF